MSDSTEDERFMRRALSLAARGEGNVEPNPMVGCVIVADGQVIGEGWHRAFGGDHAEIEALKACASPPRGATAYVTLEPCCHQGKTPPCADALIAAGLARVVVALRDPFEQVDGGGILRLREAGIRVDTDILRDDSRRLNAPYLKLLRSGRPWVIAKWAMTLDGKLATRSGHSQWISGPRSREIVHKIRGRMDAVAVGIGTALADDPQLTARPPGPRTALRLVLDSQARLPAESRLARTADRVPVAIACARGAPEHDVRRLRECGCEVVVCPGADPGERLRYLLDELGRRRLTNVLFEGGGRLLGALFDQRLCDEVHVFVAPRIAGGSEAPSPVEGTGVPTMSLAGLLDDVVVERIDDDVYVRGRTVRMPNRGEE